MAKTYTIPAVAAGQASLDNFNAPITAIQAALNQLSQGIDGIMNKSAIFAYQVPVAQTVSQGMLVYYNSTTAKFEPAIAALRAVPGTQGESLEADSCRVVGMVVQITSGVATLFCGGSQTNGDLADACLGTGALAGVYFLSSITAGKATLTPGTAMRQPVLQYFGDGKMSLAMFYMAHDNHRHAAISTGAHWKAAGSGTITVNGESVTVPTGATFYYDPADDADLVAAGDINNDVTAVFYNGTLQTPVMTAFIVSQNVLWYTGATAPVTGSVVIFNHYPFAYGDSVVRSVQSTSSRLVAQSKNGIIKLALAALTDGGTNKSPRAVSAMTDTQMAYTPIVSDVLAGSGISISRGTAGEAVISASNLIGSAVTAQDFSMNGAQRATTGLYTYTVFPAGRTSTVVMALPIEGVSALINLKSYVWGTILTGSGTLSVELYFLPLGTAVVPAEFPVTPVATTLILSSMQSAVLNYRESAGYVEFAGQGCLIAKITATNPAADIKCHRLGFRTLTTDVSGGTEAITGTRVNAITCSQFAAGQAITKLAVVKILSDKVMLCPASEAGNADLAVGVALNDAEIDEIVEYAIAGTVQDADISMTSGSLIYVGLTGALTQTLAGTQAFTQKIGIAAAADTIQINIGPSVLAEGGA